MPKTKARDLTQDLAQMEQNWKRALADYQNLVKRTEEQRILVRNVACISLIERLLPAIDNLELAATHLDDSGLTMILDQFRQALIEEGVVKIDALGQVFDPEIMECIDMVPGAENTVLEVVCQGYMISTKVLRPAKVKVGKKEEQ